MKSAGRGPFVDLLSHLFESQTNPRAAVLVAHAFFELLIDVLIKHNCKHAARITRAPYEAKLILLNELNVIRLVAQQLCSFRQVSFVSLLWTGLFAETLCLRSTYILPIGVTGMYGRLRAKGIICSL